MNLKKLLEEMIKRDASDLFCRAGSPPRLRIDGKIVTIEDSSLSVDEMLKVVEELTTPAQREKLKVLLDIDFAFFSQEFDRRLRVSIFIQRNWPAFVIRNVRKTISSFEEDPDALLRHLEDGLAHGRKADRAV